MPFTINHSNNTSCISCKFNNKNYHELFKNMILSIFSNIIDIIFKYHENNDFIDIIFHNTKLDRFSSWNFDNKHSYLIASNCFKDITYQIKLLKEFNKSFIAFDNNDIIVLTDKNNHSHFFIANFDILYNLHNNYVYITSPPLMSTLYFSPELKSIKILPSQLYHSSVYYSLGLFLLQFFDNTKLIIHTPLYYSISRCMYQNPNKRLLLSTY